MPVVCTRREDAVVMTVDSNELIRRRAFEIWEREGCPDGRDLEHWLQAEVELSAPASSVTEDKPAARKPAAKKAAAKPAAAKAATKSTAGKAKKATVPA